MRRMMWGAVAMLVAGPVAAQDVERLRGSEVAIYNIAGQVEVVRGSGADVVVRIERGGRDSGELSVEIGDVRGREALRVIYPSDEIVYPEMGRGSNTQMSIRSDGTFSDGGRGRNDRVRIRGRGDGMEAWADMVIEVPDGTDLSVYLAVGEVVAEGVEGDLSIDTGSGAVRAASIVGELSIDTGSGSISVRGVDGDVSIDTGSGRIEASEIRGRSISIDTGSGSVNGFGLEADEIIVDTGSGSIELESVTAPEVHLDTGSGSIDIELMSDVERLEADTGSGSVTVRAPQDLGARVEIETGSGGIDLDFPVEVRTVRRDHLEGTVGDGRGQISIDTGSGSIKLLRTRGPAR